MTLYSVLRRFVRLVVNTFFRQVEVIGIEGVPSEGPVIFAGNHPNALMDGLLLIAKSPRHPIRFVANAMRLSHGHGHMTFGGWMPAEARGFPAASMARKNAGDWRDPDQVRMWAKQIAEDLHAG